MSRADVDPGVEATRTVDLPGITKSVQEPAFRANTLKVGLTLAANEPTLNANSPQRAR